MAEPTRIARKRAPLLTGFESLQARRAQSGVTPRPYTDAREHDRRRPPARPLRVLAARRRLQDRKARRPRARSSACRRSGLTDHGVLNGAVEFYKACRKHGVKPILGLEAYLVDDRREREKVRYERNHLTLAGPQRRRLPEPDQALLARLPGGLPPRPGERRPGAAGAPLGGGDRALGLPPVPLLPADHPGARAGGPRPRRRPAGRLRRRTTSTSRSRTTRSRSRTARTRASCGSRASWAGRWSGRRTSTTCAARTTRPTPRCCACRRSPRSRSRSCASTRTSSI